LVNTYSDFRFTYGVMEARVQFDGTTTIANWPAFWANGTGRWPTTGEIDVMEGLVGKTSWYYHWGKGRGDAVGDEMPLTGLADSLTGWHTFAADWEPGVITYYFDGVQVGQVTSGVVNTPMHLIVNYALSNTISPPVKVPSTFLVDYVRVWQH
jgi:beta-glucanase (GH16 family)